MVEPLNEAFKLPSWRITLNHYANIIIHIHTAGSIAAIICAGSYSVLPLIKTESICRL